MDKLKRTQLNKSFSNPDISKPQDQSISRRIIYREIIEYSNNPPLLRQFSCAELYDRNRRLNDSSLNYSRSEERQPSFLNFDDSFTNYKNVESISDNLNDKIESDIVPMDVDLDFDSEDQTQSFVIKKMDTNKKPSRKLVVQNLKKADTVKKYKRKTIFTLRNLIAVVFVICGCYIYQNYPLLLLKNTIESKELERELHDEIVGQNEAVDIVSESVKNIDDWGCKIKILPFIGETGVGKTYMANILKRHFVLLAHEYKGSHLLNLEEKEKLLTNLQSCCCNLLIIDDLSIDDGENVVNFIHSLPDTYSMLILPIFNIQTINQNSEDVIHYNHVDAVKDLFEKPHFCNKVVHFNAISEISLKTWLKGEMDKRKVPVSKQNELSEFIFKQHNIKHGFKGLHAKLLLATNQ